SSIRSASDPSSTPRRRPTPPTASAPTASANSPPKRESRPSRSAGSASTGRPSCAGAGCSASAWSRRSVRPRIRRPRPGSCSPPSPEVRSEHTPAHHPVHRRHRPQRRSRNPRRPQDLHRPRNPRHDRHHGPRGAEHARSVAGLPDRRRFRGDRKSTRLNSSHRPSCSPLPCTTLFRSLHRRSGVSTRPPITLSIAGTDPSGGAGIHADLKTFTARGTLGTTVITALVAQNTHGVSRVYPIDVDFVADQFDSVLDDMPVDASKSGMLGTRRLIELVAARAATGRRGFFTADPVMIATSGHRLLAADAVDAVRTHLLPAADLIPPNLPEAALLLGDDEPEAQTPEQMRDQARRLLDRGPGAVLLKGGHGTHGDVTDILATRDG